MMTEEEDNRIIRMFCLLGKKIRLESRFKVINEDPDDDVFINTAYDGDANFIVTGDSYLLRLKECNAIKIISVAEMLKLL